MMEKIMTEKELMSEWDDIYRLNIAWIIEKDIDKREKMRLKWKERVDGWKKKMRMKMN